MKTLRSRLVLSHLAPVLITLPLFLLALTVVIETQLLLSGLSERLTEEARLIAEMTAVQPELWQDSAESAAYALALSVHIDSRILLLEPDGDLLASSDPADSELVGDFVEIEGVETAVNGQSQSHVSYGVFRQSVEVFVPVRGVQQQVIGIVGITQSLDGAASQVGRLRGFALAMLAIEILIAGGLGLYLARRLGSPLSEAATAVIAIADGKQIEPVRETGARETRQLARAVNQLAERLRLLEEIRRRSLANIVHELGRPLGAIRAAVHVIGQEPGDNPEVRRELAEGIEQAIEQMQPLLDDLTLLHGHTEGTAQLAKEEVALSEWLPPLLLPWRAMALEKGLEWQTDIPADLPTLSIDPARMGQAIGNLLSNAVKYTGGNGRVSVTVGATAVEVSIQISDTGQGIRLEEQERIFEPFYRSEQARRFPQGLGVGLTIARDLIEAHDGRLELTSVFNEGSQFTIFLPNKPTVEEQL